MKLHNKVALITGASMGIGKAIAQLFAREGAKVAIAYIGDHAPAEETVKEIKSKGGEAIAIFADVSKPDEVRHLFAETLKAYGTLDILVNNAGIERPKPFMDLTLPDIEFIFRVNLFSMFLTCQEAAKLMREKKQGKIINTASMRGLPHCGRASNMDYSASKAGVINLTTTLAKELAPDIQVNAVAPGPANTEMAKNKSPQLHAKTIEDIYLKRLIEPDEIADAVLFLATNDAITGEVLVVDGGYQLK